MGVIPSKSAQIALAGILEGMRTEDPSYSVIFSPRYKFGCSGATRIAAALKTNTTVTVLQLCGTRAVVLRARADTFGAPDNLIGESGATAVAEALRVNASVVAVRLTGTPRRARWCSPRDTRVGGRKQHWPRWRNRDRGCARG